ncbi:MAG: hypothetical protein GC171_10585 [Terrimonas sp.]|nr:hypothetical protein [Terrimonas sp.]
MKRGFNRNVSLLLLLVTYSIPLLSQQDTSKKKTVDIISEFKPVLKASAKINFNPSPAPNDTVRPVLNYNIPNQNLLFAYQPGTLQPLALSIDSGGRWDNSSYVKAGFGSLKSPLVEAGFSLGDGKTAGLNIYAKHISAEGKRDFQDFSNTKFALKGFLQTSKNLEWDATLGMQQDRYNKYGFMPATLSFPKDSIQQRFQTITGGLGFHNLKLTDFGLSYSPRVKMDVFSDNHKNNESNTFIDLPLQKTIGKVFAVNLGVTFDLTRLKPDNKSAINNTFYYISPSVLFKTPNINLQAGVRPSWDNKTFKMFPNIMAEIGTDDQRFTFQAGLIGYLRKTSYQYLSSQNPWLYVPGMLNNSAIEERYAGFKGSAGDHLTYSAKVGFNKITNQPLFVNDDVDGKSFFVINEPGLNVLHFGAELGYTVQEKFSLLTGLNFNQYTKLKENEKAWGLLPLELKAAMRLQVLKDLWLKSDLFAWSGPQYKTMSGGADKLSGAFDLNAGLEFRFSKSLNFWAQFNNLFNNTYQRWNQYPVYGFNFQAGIIFSFDQKNIFTQK